MILIVAAVLTSGALLAAIGAIYAALPRRDR